MKLNITNVVEVIKLPYSGCSIILEEVNRIKMQFYGGAYTASDLKEPLQLGTLGPGGRYDCWDFNFK